MKRISVAGPSISEKEVQYVLEAVRDGWYENAAKFPQRFEEAFAKKLGMRHAVALPSCTSAIHLALAGLGVGPGDEVIVPDITWIGSSAPVSYVGATTVFADVDPRTWCMSAASFEACITPRTKAVIPVDLYGNMPDYDAIRAIAKNHGIAIIEDAAQAIGATYKGRPAGALGDAGVFSFHGTKTLTTGEGGMLVTDDEKLLRRVLLLRDHGRDPGGRLFWNVEVAHKYRMGSLQAALGLAQLERLDELVAKKRTIFGWYQRRLKGMTGVTLNDPGPDVEATYWMPTAIFPGAAGLDKESIMAALSKESIDSRPFFYPLSSMPAYSSQPEAAKAAKRNTTSYAISPYGVNLPSALRLDESDIDRVCHAVRAMMENVTKPKEGVKTAALNR